MTTTIDPPASPPPAPSPRWLRILIIVIAAIELIGALNELSGLSLDFGQDTGLLLFAQNATAAKIVLTPFPAAAALFFAITRRLRYAIIALAVLILLGWLADLPSVALNGLELEATIGGAGGFIYRFIYPLLAIAALVFAVRDERLVLAGVLACLPTIFNGIGFFTFAALIMYYGF